MGVTFLIFGVEYTDKQWEEARMNNLEINLSKPWETVEDRVAWRAVVHGTAKSWTRLSD